MLSGANSRCNWSVKGVGSGGGREPMSSCFRHQTTHLWAVGVVPGVTPPGEEKPHVNFDVEKGQGQEGKNPQEDRSGDVHVVLDVDGVISETEEKQNETERKEFGLKTRRRQLPVFLSMFWYSEWELGPFINYSRQHGTGRKKPLSPSPRNRSMKTSMRL